MFSVFSPLRLPWTNSLLKNIVFLFIWLFITALPFIIRSFNSLDLAYLKGSAKHSEVAKLITRRAIFIFLALLVATLFTSNGSNISIAYLILVLTISEFFICNGAKKLSIIERFTSIPSYYNKTKNTLLSGYPFFLSNRTIYFLFFIDCLILGFLVDIKELGTYSEAIMLINFFLLLAQASKPVLRNILSNPKLSTQGTLLSSLIQVGFRVPFAIASFIGLLTAFKFRRCF